MRSARTPLSVLCAVASLVSVGWCKGQGLGEQEKSRASAQAATNGLRLIYFGVSACRKCHKNPDTDDPPLLCRCNEIGIWTEKDKHKDAYTKLSGSRGKKIIELLKYSESEVSKNCVICHGVHVTDAKLEGGGFRIEDGVSCVVCHGPYDKWVNEHGGVTHQEWRAKDRAEKQERYGMTDLWDPAKRATLCASCHIGDSGKGRFVTHDMYAAGHPLLPGIEFSTFSDEMPRHWQYLKEKIQEKRKPKELELLKDYYKSPKLEQTKLVLIGAVVSFQQAMKLLIDQAEKCAEPKQAAGSSIDFAQLDCFACHHDLQVRSWRQERGYVGKAGRPQVRPWPMALLRTAIYHAGHQDGTADALYRDLQKNLRELYTAFDERPFGNCEHVLRAGKDLVKWSEGLMQKLDGAKYDDEAVAWDLLQQFCSLATAGTPDYDTARQIGWAFQAIYKSDVSAKPADDSKIKEQLALLKRDLHLDLPSTQQKEIEQDLSTALQKISNYDPAPIKKAFLELGNLLAPKPGN